MEQRPDVTVVVPVRDGVGTLGLCLDALARQEPRPHVEVIVVDNGSRDGTVSVARAHHLQPIVVREPQPGSYAARNRGIACATAPVVAFTDADCLPARGWLAAGLARLGAGADLVGGAIEPLRSATPSVWERYDRAVYLDQRDYVERQSFAATANLFARREVFDHVGGFDPLLQSSGDLEFGRRATGAGFRLVYAPEAVVRHPPRTTLTETWRLHRRLGAGWAALHERGRRGTWWQDPALRLSLGEVVNAVAADGPPLRRRHLLPVHLVVLAARVTGRVTGRG